MKVIMRRLAVLFYIAISTVVPSTGAVEMQKSAQLLASLKNGEYVTDEQSITAFTTNGHLNRATLHVLANELRTGNEPVRKKIIDILVNLGINDDVPAPDKFRVIRNQLIIRILLVDGFAKSDAARGLAEKMLLRYCMPADLSKFKREILQELNKGRTDYALIAAKAKLLSARSTVESLALKDGLGEAAARKLRIAQAALGNTAVEDEILLSVEKSVTEAPIAPPNQLYDVGAARDGKHTSALLQVLGAVGTERTLRLACSFLRTDLKTYVPGVKERSLRYVAVNALHYNYPDEAVLADPYTVAHWRAIEAFCTARLGATFEGPAPGLPDEFIYFRRR